MTESMRGMRLGSLSMEREEGVELAERRSIYYLCRSGHETRVTFALGAEIPSSWSCKACHSPAARLIDGEEVAQPLLEAEAPRTHYDMVLERRSRAELEALLSEVLADMRKRRAEGRLTA